MQFDLFTDFETKKSENAFYTGMGNGGQTSLIKYGKAPTEEEVWYPSQIKDREDAINILSSISNLSYASVQRIIQKAESEPDEWQEYQRIPDEFFIF